jgi:hypothetical protein
MMLLVPSDVLRPRRVDDNYTAEADAARAAGHDVVVIDHDALTRNDAQQAVVRVPAGTDADAVYRGWMLRSEHYAAFADAVAARGVRLRTSPLQYRQAHELPAGIRRWPVSPRCHVGRPAPAGQVSTPPGRRSAKARQCCGTTPSR